MKKQYDHLTEIMKVVKQRAEEHELTIKEISDNAEVPEDLINIFFDDSNHVIEELSKLFNFFKVNLAYRKLTFRPYLISGTKKQFKIRRRIKPYCHAYYDNTTKKFYMFAPRYNSIKISKTEKQLILREMKTKIDRYLKDL